MCAGFRIIDGLYEAVGSAALRAYRRLSAILRAGKINYYGCMSRPVWLGRMRGGMAQRLARRPD